MAIPHRIALAILLASVIEANHVQAQTVFAQTVFAQTTPRAEFEAATIKPFVRNERDRSAAGIHIDGSQVRAAGLSLRTLAGIAYKIKATLIFGPDWTASDRYEISAALPAGATQAQLPEMFEALLADRFQMKVHREKKELPVYALVQGKGPLKLKASIEADSSDDAGKVNVSSASAGNGISVNLGGGSSYTFANNRFDATKLTMAVFASNLERFSDRYIVDMTGLTGRYDFAFDVTTEDYRAMMLRSVVWAGVDIIPPEVARILENASPAALGDALQQVGLKLEPRKAPLDVLVIDSALKTPTEN
jgi:uncharacterized protein (TIGR03435 family)